jgi:hypothetical protein
MFSIRKKHKVQVLYKEVNLWFSCHPTLIPENFHEETSKKVILKYSKAVHGAISKQWSTIGASKEVGYNPNDWYGIPKIYTIPGLRKWLRRTWINITLDTSDETLWVTLWKSIKIAQDYLSRKEYYLPKKIQNGSRTTLNEVLALLREMQKYSKDGDIMACTIFLKVIRAAYKNITLLDSQEHHVFNPLTGELQEKDKKFASDIMKFFNNSEYFQYTQELDKLSKESVIAHGRSQKHGTDAEFSVTVDFKILDSQLLKTISQNLYDAAEAIWDRSRMQISVWNKKDVLQMCLVMIESGLLQKGIKWEQKRDIINENDPEWENFQSSYIKDSNLAHKSLLERIPVEKMKWNTSQRQEVKITSTHPSFEIQIVLIWNDNESGYNASPYYKMKADIDEEITLRWGYITKDRIIKHITRRLPDLTKFWQSPHEKDPEKIFQYFVESEKKIIPLYEKSYMPRLGNSPSYKHVKIFTNKDFTSRWVSIYEKNLPYKIWHETTWNFSSLNTISSPSTL